MKNIITLSLTAGLLSWGASAFAQAPAAVSVPSGTLMEFQLQQPVNVSVTP